MIEHFPIGLIIMVLAGSTLADRLDSTAPLWLCLLSWALGTLVKHNLIKKGIM